MAYVEILPDERQGSATAFLKRAVAWYAQHGIKVQRLLTDNGSCYHSKLFAKTRRGPGMRHSFTRPYRPRTNGKAERLIQTPEGLGLSIRLRFLSPTTTMPGKLSAFLQLAPTAPGPQSIATSE